MAGQGSALHFNAAQSMKFSPGSVPLQHTIIVKARYTAGSNGRIFASTTGNNLYGWHGGCPYRHYEEMWLSSKFSCSNQLDMHIFVLRNAVPFIQEWGTLQLLFFYNFHLHSTLL